MKQRSLSLSNGQNVVEYALMLPFMLFIIIVFIDMGRLMFHYSTITNISRETARYASVNPCMSKEKLKLDIEERAIGISSDNLNFDEPVWNPTDCSFLLPPDYATVKISVNSVFKPLPVVVNILGLFLEVGLDDTITLNSTSTMRLELFIY